jgi:hypothetical protein
MGSAVQEAPLPEAEPEADPSVYLGEAWYLHILRRTRRGLRQMAAG